MAVSFKPFNYSLKRPGSFINILRFLPRASHDEIFLSERLLMITIKKIYSLKFIFKLASKANLKSDARAQVP